MQFGFSEGIRCLDESYVISESISQLLEKGGIVFACFLDVRKAFDSRLNTWSGVVVNHKGTL